MSRPRRNKDEDAVPASSGSAPYDHLSYNKAIENLQVKSRKQIDRISKLATFAEQMKFHLKIISNELGSGKRKDRDRASRINKLIDGYENWKNQI
jgi:hypothetical protein